MNPREAEHMIGGYATGSLTPAERDALFRAALEDQQLFETLADEDALRELLADPAVRQRLLGHLTPKPSAWQRFVAWIGQPVPMAATATVAIGFVAASLLFQAREPRQPATAPVQAAADMPREPEPEAKVQEMARNQAPPPPAKPVALADKTEKTRAAKPFAPPPPAPIQAPAVEAPPELRAEASAAPVPTLPAGPPPAAEPPRARLAKQVAAAPPFRYHIERLQADGNWVQFGGELGRGDRVRLRVTAAQPGVVILREGSRVLQSQRVEPEGGYTFEIASTGQRGERAFELGFSQTDLLGQATALRFASGARPAAVARAKTTAPAEAEKKAAVAASADAVSNTVESPYFATVRLKFE